MRKRTDIDCAGKGEYSEDFSRCGEVCYWRMFIEAWKSMDYKNFVYIEFLAFYWLAFQYDSQDHSASGWW